MVVELFRQLEGLGISAHSKPFLVSTFLQYLSKFKQLLLEFATHAAHLFTLFLNYPPASEASREVANLT